MESQLHVWERVFIGILIYVLQQHISVGDDCILGYTSPQGVLRIRTGSDLIINCTLQPDPHVRNSSQLFWVLAGQVGNANSVQVINENTAQLRTPNAQKAAFMAYCKWNSTTGSTYNICRNKVYVGDPPAENIPINCTSYNFSKITCNWPTSSADEILNSKWTLKQGVNRDITCSTPMNHRTEGRSFIGQLFCISRKPCFVLQATNELGKSESWLSFNHYHNVILSAPTSLAVSEVTKRTALISWADNAKYKSCVNGFYGFHRMNAMVQYKLTYSKKNVKDDPINTTSTINKSLSLHNLAPFTTYFVEIRCRFVYNGSNNSWGESSSLEFKTLPGVPTMSPKNAMVHISMNSKERSITLYWTGVPKDQQAGRNFRYAVIVSCNNTEYTEVNTTNTYVALPNLTSQVQYKLKVQAVNEVGVSKEASYTYFSEDNIDDVLGLEFHDVILQDDKHDVWNYVLSWKMADNKVYNVSVYYCRGNASDAGVIQCDDSGIQFQENVSTQNATYAFNLSNPTSGLQDLYFGVAFLKSAKSRSIVWSSCIIPTSRKPQSPKLKDWIYGSTWVYLTWELKCEQKAAYISGYKIYVYHNNKEIINRVTTANVTTSNITNLEPHTEYIFGISTMTLSLDSDLENITVATLLKPTKQPQQKNLPAIIIPIGLFSVLVPCGAYFLLKCLSRFRVRVKELKNIEVPSGLTEHHQLLSSMLCSDPKNLRQTNPPSSESGGFSSNVDALDDLVPTPPTTRNESSVSCDPASQYSQAAIDLNRGSIEADSDNNPTECDVGLRVSPELRKNHKTSIAARKATLNCADSVCYAQLSFAASQLLSSEGISNESEFCTESTVGHANVTVSEDGAQTSSDKQQVKSASCRSYVDPRTATQPSTILVPD